MTSIFGEGPLEPLSASREEAFSDVPPIEPFKQNVVRGLQENPDRKAQDLSIAKDAGLPVEAISDGTREDVRKNSAFQQINRKTKNAPVTRGLFGDDPLMPMLASDDIDNLVNLERNAKKLTFRGAFSSGVDTLQSLGYSFVEAVGEATGAETLTEVGREGRERELREAELSRRGAKFTKFQDITSAEDFFQWLKEKGGEQIPLMAPSLATAAGGAAIGTAILPGVGTVIGGVLGAFIPSFVLGAGETQQAIKERDPSTVAPGFAFGGGALIGLMDSALPGKVGSQLVKAFGVEVAEQVLKRSAVEIAKRVTKEGGKGFAVEGVTEALQEVVSEAAAAQATDTKINQEELVDQMIEAFAAGAFLGGITTTSTTLTTEAYTARRTKHAMDEVHTAKKESKLGSRDPERLNQATVADLKAAGVEQIYVTPDAVIQYAAEHPDGVGEALLKLGVSEDLPKALRNGTPVAVPVQNFSSEVLGTDNYDLLASHMAVSLDDKTLSQAAESLLEIGELETTLLPVLEAHNATPQLKERVAQTINQMKPGNMAEIVDSMAPDVGAVLADVIDRVETATTETQAQIDEAIAAGRIEQLDEEILRQDEQIVRIQREIETRTQEGKPTKQQEKRLAKAASTAQKKFEEQERVREKAEQVKTTKAIKTKAGTLKKLKVKITSETVKAVRAGFRAAARIGETTAQTKTELTKAVSKMKGLTRQQKTDLQKSLLTARTPAALRKKVEHVQSRAATLVEANRRKELKATIKAQFKKTKAKSKPGGVLVGKFDPDTQVVIDQLNKIISLPVTVARERLENSIEADFPLENPLESHMLAIAANDENISVDQMEKVLLDLVDIKTEGKIKAINRELSRKRRVAKAAQAGVEATTQGEPVAMVKSSGFMAKLHAASHELIDSLSAMHNGWDEVLDIVFNKADVDATQLIESLRITNERQKYKGRVLNWEQGFIERAIDKLQLRGYSQFLDRSADDDVVIDFGVHLDKNENKVRLQYAKSQIRKLWMEYQDPDLKRVIEHKAGNAFTQDMLNALFGVLEQTDYDYANAQLDLYRELYGEINPVYRRIYGVNMPFSEFYSPIQRDKGEEAIDGGRDSFGADTIVHDEMQFRKTIPNQLRSRQPNITPLKKRSDTGAMMRYMHDMAWFIEGAEKVIFLKNVFASEPLKKAIEAHHSASMVRTINGFIQDFGPGHAKMGTVVEQFIATTNRRFSTSVLALKGTIATKQLVSVFAMADNIPTTAFMKSVAQFASPKKAKEIVNFLYRNSPALQARGSSLDFELARIGEAKEPLFKFKHRAKMEDIFFALIKLGDRVPIYLGGWAVYQNAIKNGKSKEQAIREFEDAMNTTQQSTDIDKMSALQRHGAIGRTLTMFMTARMALLRGELRAWRQRPKAIGGRGKIGYKEFGKRMAYYHVFMPMLIQFIASGFGWEEDRQLTAALLGQLNSFVILGDLLTEAVTLAVSDEPKIWRKDSNIPIVSIGNEMIEGFSEALASNAHAEDMIDAIKELAGVVGNLAGVPVDQITNIMGGVKDVKNGDTEKGLKRIWGLSERVAEESSR